MPHNQVKSHQAITDFFIQMLRHILRKGAFDWYYTTPPKAKGFLLSKTKAVSCGCRLRESIIPPPHLTRLSARRPSPRKLITLLAFWVVGCRHRDSSRQGTVRLGVTELRAANLETNCCEGKGECVLASNNSNRCCWMASGQGIWLPRCHRLVPDKHP